jgi:hypothetical protein
LEKVEPPTSLTEIPIQHDEKHSELRWGPLFSPLETRLHSGDPLLLVISPFIGLEALQRFIAKAGSLRGIKVIVRWRPEDLRNGVSDIAIFPYLSEQGIPLYINQDIHLKLYVFESNSAFCTSGNLTLRGFGYNEKANIEVGCFVSLVQDDWLRLYELISKSRQVDERMFSLFKQYLAGCPEMSQPPPPPPELFGPGKAYTISSLPAMETPTKLAEFYFASELANKPAEEVRRAAHDCAIFALPPGLDHVTFNQRLGLSFRTTPFVVDFIEMLKTEKSLRFGAVNDWIHRKCEDVPLPYRWEIKENTRIFYNWLQHFVPEITWDRPNYSQVIHWQEP